MLTASAKFRPAVAWFARQIAPSVLATLIAALVIAGYNRAFSGHLQQPRMAALHAAENAVLPPAVASTTGSVKISADDDTAAKPRPAWLDKVTALTDLAAEQERIADKDEGREAVKDGKINVADAAPTAVAPAPAAPRPVAAKPERREFRPEPRTVEQRAIEQRPAEPRVVSVDPRGPAPVAPPPGGYLAVQQPMPQPVIVQQPMQPVAVAPAPGMVPAQPPVVVAAPVAQEPAPVITAKPMVTVPDRAGMRPTYEPPLTEEASAQGEQQRGVFGSIVNTLKPSSIFKSAREFGDKIEAVGNDILPTIRQ